MASLHILKGTEQNKRIPLQDETTIMGRNRDCQVVIDFPAVSRQHAHILRIDGKFYIEDRESRNGTFVNNQQITGRTLLKDNDRIKICDFLCTFEEGAPKPALKPLPGPLQPDEPEIEEVGSSSTVEATIGANLSANQILSTQPADKLKAMLEISSSLSKTLELDVLLPKITDNLFQLFRQADRCFLIQKDDAGKLVPKLVRTRRANTETNARFSRSIVQQCLDKAAAFLSEDASTDSRFGLSQSIADFRIRSVMCAPLMTAEGKAVGVIQLDTQDRSKKFVEDDLKLLVGVASQVAVALENAQLHTDLLARDRFQRDLDLAKQVQRGFLPQAVPNIPGYQFYAHYEAAQSVGGDYYDFIPLPGNRLAVMLGDVAGKGIPAALLMAKLSAETRFCMLTESNPAVGVSKLNEMMLKAGMMDRFVTMAAVVLDPAQHSVIVVNAGHQTPLLYRAGSGKVEDATSSDIAGLPLGVMEGFEYASQKVDLKVGESLLIFTDGVTDALNTQGQAFLMKGVQDAVAGLKAPTTTPAEVGERIIKAVKQHSTGRSPHDDIAFVSLGRTQKAT
jgi:serine phosphatase RsbU (regulator of sigma subunit)